MIVAAPAKINLTLEVTGVEDNGYHTLDTIFSWLELEDSLELEPAEQTELRIVGNDALETDESNLVLKAHRAAEKLAGRALPTVYNLTKRIPAGGGLGGGSADAAAALVGLNRLYDLNLTQEELLAAARPLGADVSFGLVGGAARGTRYGDILEPVELPKSLFDRTLVLLFPEFGCPTPTVYGIWDKNPSKVASGASDRFLQSYELEAIANDLEEPAFELHPPLRDFKSAMGKAGLEAVCLSGSGSTMFGFLPPEGDMDKVEQDLSTLGVKILATKLKERTRVELVS